MQNIIYLYSSEYEDTNIEYAIELTKKTFELMPENYKYKDIILTAAMLYNKYGTEDNKKKICEKIKENQNLSDTEIDTIFTIIDNISLKNVGNLELSEEIIEMLNIVSDAHKLELFNLNRMMKQHQKDIENKSMTYGEKIISYEKYILDFCEENLFLLISENIIKTNKGIELAKPLLKKLKKTVLNKNIIRVELRKFLLHF